MSTVNDSVSLFEERNQELLERFKTFEDREKFGVLYNWVIQRVITVKLFKQMLGYLVQQEMNNEEHRGT